MSSTTSLLGLGNMGTALAQALLKAGKQVTIWNRTTSRPAIASLIEAGAVLESNISTAISKSSVIIICVLDNQTIHSILGSLSLEFKTIINLTNGTPRQAREMKEELYRLGAAKYFDGGIMATPEMIATPASLIFVSGESEERFEAVKDIIEVFGRTQYVGEDSGAASLHDLSLLTGMYGMFAGAITAMAMLKKSGSVEPRVSQLLIPWLQALVPYIAEMAKSIDAGAFGSLGNPVGMQGVALKNILQTCVEEGVDGGNLLYFSELVDKVIAEHGGDGGIAQVGELL